MVSGAAADICAAAATAPTATVLSRRHEFFKHPSPEVAIFSVVFVSSIFGVGVGMVLGKALWRRRKKGVRELCCF